MYDKCYFCLDQLPKLKKESTASFFVNFGGAGVQKSRPTLLYILLSGRHPFVNNKRSSMGIRKLKKSVLAGNVNMEGRSWAKISEEGKQLVRSLLKV